MEKGLHIIGEKNDVRVLYGTRVLFQKIGFGSWTYIHNVNGILTHESVQRFDDSYLATFFGDITSQLESGVHPDNLIINIKL